VKALDVEMRLLCAILMFFWAGSASADIRKFICYLSKENPEIASFILEIDVDNQSMKLLDSAWKDKITVTFEERYIMNIDFNRKGRIGGMILLFDRYTGELVMGGTNVDDFTNNKNSDPVTQIIWQCSEKKI